MRGPVEIERVQFTCHANAVPAVWHNNSCDTAQQYSFMNHSTQQAFPCAGPHSTSEGWVRPQGVGPCALHRTCVRTMESVTGQQADLILVQSFAMPETV